MKLCECQMGVMVCVKSDRNRIGHVVGLTKNVQDHPEVIPVIHFAAEPEPTPYHHSGLELFTEF